jgi:hypothetical protein
MTEVVREPRRQQRVPLKVPVRVEARDPDGVAWEATAHSADASAEGLALRIGRTARIGQLLHLSLPLPATLRRYDLADPSYRVYALVRNLARLPDGSCRVGVLFFGRQPPRDPDALPAELFLMPGEPTPVERRRHPRHVVSLPLRLEAESILGGTARDERAVAEDIGAWGAFVRSATPPAGKGSRLRVEEVDGDFKARAEVRGTSIGADGVPRLNLLFLDGPVPERLLPTARTHEA